MAATLDLARERGYSQLFIETYSSPTFERARAFYAARGFEQVGAIRGYMPDGA
jgi:predicted GNAT superfamily acetyltransferase